MSDQTNKGKSAPTPSRKAQEAANRKPLMIPSMLVMLLGLGITGQGKTISALAFWLQVGVLAYMWLLFIAVAIQAWLLGRKAKSAVAARYGAASVERGLAMYAAMRSAQFRPMRMPKPMVKRGQKL
mgnify:CR=1 FL=1